MASATAMHLPPGVVRVLEQDPDLAADVPPRTAELLRRRAVARTLELPTGPWEAPSDPVAYGGHLGLLVLDGVLTRDLLVAGTTCAELLGPGDLLRPWDTLGESPLGSTRVTWEVLTPTRVALLDRDFTLTVGRVPELTTAIVGRSVRRARWIALHLAIRCLKRIDARLLVLLWHLADRFGRVTPEGVVVPLGLTHARLGRLVGAQRPSVTSALGELAARGLVSRRDDGSWLLRGTAPRSSRASPGLGRRASGPHPDLARLAHMDVRDRVPQPPPPPPKPSTGVSIHTLVLAALSAGAAALLTSTFWPRGSIYSAALTPVIVALVSELLRKPTARVGQVATSIPGRRLGRRRRVGGAGRPALDRPDPTATSRAPADSDRPYVVYGRPRIRPRVVLATAALAFIIAVVAITLSEQIFGGAVANDRQRTFLPGRSSAEDERPEEELAPDAGKTDAETDTTQTQTTTTTTTTTTPEGERAPTQTDGPQPATPTTTTPAPPATPPSAPESQAQPPG